MEKLQIAHQPQSKETYKTVSFWHQVASLCQDLQSRKASAQKFCTPMPSAAHQLPKIRVMQRPAAQPAHLIPKRNQPRAKKSSKNSSFPPLPSREKQSSEDIYNTSQIYVDNKVKQIWRNINLTSDTEECNALRRDLQAPTAARKAKQELLTKFGVEVTLRHLGHVILVQELALVSLFAQSS